MKPVRFHPTAEAEMVAAAVYYEQQLSDLGKRFLVTVRESVSRIQISPQLYPIVDLDVRRCLTKTSSTWPPLITARLTATPTPIPLTTSAHAVHRRSLKVRIPVPAPSLAIPVVAAGVRPARSAPTF